MHEARAVAFPIRFLSPNLEASIQNRCPANQANYFGWPFRVANDAQAAQTTSRCSIFSL